MSESKPWHVSRAEEQFGPFSSKELKEMVATGHIVGDDLVWREGMEDWVWADRIKGLFQIESQQASTPPPAPASLLNTESFPVFPLLKSYDWEHKGMCIHQNFNDLDKPPVPLVAFCHDTEEGYKMITHQAAEKNGWTCEALRNEAQENIDAYPTQWEEVNGFILTASGKDFSSEKMLSKPFLLEAHEQLGAEEILVAVPRRTVLYAANNDMSDEAMATFMTVVARTLFDDSFGHQVISPLIFRYEDAKMVGAMIAE